MTLSNADTFGPFRLGPVGWPGLTRSIGHTLGTLMEKALALPALHAVYEQTRASVVPASFAERALGCLGVPFDVSEDDLRRIPASGPLIVVSNHPFGGLDGLILTVLLQRIRPDVRVLANYLLGRIPELHETCLFVDPFGGPAATARNRKAMRSAVRWVRDGGALGIFPAGEVSHFTPRTGCVTDPPWEDSMARLVLRTEAAVLPVYFDGRNSRFFHVVGLLHPRLRTMMLPRELLAGRGRRVRVQIGTPIPYSRLSRYCCASEDMRAGRSNQTAQLTEYLRLRTYILKNRCAEPSPASARPRKRGSCPPPADARTIQPIVIPLPPSDIAAEIDALPAEHCLLTSGPWRVYFGSAGQLPKSLHEIGRLRECAFRMVGEGTGRETDLDRFDNHYLHLFAWNTQTQAVAGAYRLGQTDVLLNRFGADGLYTSTLFHYRPPLLKQLDPALELGRSFVAPEYQRDYAPLLLLWKGIGQFVARHPRYRRLFGAVSISDEFHSMTKQLLMAFLTVHCLDRGLAPLVRPKNPQKTPRFRDVDVRHLATLVDDLAGVEELVGEIESSRRTIPVLLRQYLKLNAKLLGFNIDPVFGDVLDGLVYVDLSTVDRPILERYMGKIEAAAFLAGHQYRIDGGIRR